jgi:hypothetical protein
MALTMRATGLGHGVYKVDVELQRVQRRVVEGEAARKQWFHVLP